MVAIAHRKGVTKCHHYNDNINAETFPDFLKEHFPEMFKAGNNTERRLFLQDGGLSQSSRIAQDAMDATTCRLFKIPHHRKRVLLVGNQMTRYYRKTYL